MNKGRRHELKMLKYKKRLTNLGLKDEEGKFFAYRSHGSPCSCGMCSYLKYDRKNPKFKKGGLVNKNYVSNRVII